MIFPKVMGGGGEGVVVMTGHKGTDKVLFLHNVKLLKQVQMKSIYQEYIFLRSFHRQNTKKEQTKFLTGDSDISQQ